MDASTLEAEQASIEEDILKLQLHSVSLNLSLDEEQQEEEEDDDEDEDEAYLLSAFEDPDQPSTSGINVGASTSGLGQGSAPPITLDADSEDDELPPEGEEEGELIDLSEDLEANPHNILKLNIAYQEVIQQQILLVDELLEQNKLTLSEVNSEMEEEHYNDNGKLRVPKADLGLCLSPFFRNNTFFAGGDRLVAVEIPPHPDVDRRYHELGEHFIGNPLKPSKWKKTEEKKLTEAVSRISLRQKLEPLMSRLEYLEEKYKATADEEIKEKITDVRAQIEAVKAAEQSILLGNREDKHDWMAISNIDMDGQRTQIECSLYWRNSLHPSINKKPWTAQEDSNLKHIARKHHEKNWKGIATALGTGRTPLQCIQRYQKNNLDHRVKPWTPEEDERLKELVTKYRAGHVIPHTLISLKMRNRSAGQICHRWNKSIDPTYKRSKWTPEEDIQLLKAIIKYGQRWSVIRDSGMVPGRNDAQCRERWENTLRGVNRDPWTKEEDKIIADLVDKKGEGHWSTIAQALDRRTDNQVLNRWKYMKKSQEKGIPIKYKEKGPKTIIDGIAEVRQKLIDTIEQKGASKKGGVTPQKKLKSASKLPITAGEEQQHFTPSQEPVGRLPGQVIRISTPIESHKKLKWIGTDLQESLKKAKDPEELLDIYRNICERVANFNSPRDETLWIRTDRIMNERIFKAIDDICKPFKHLGLKEGSNIHVIHHKVLETLKMITPKIIFVHYIKAMNINAEKALRAIQENTAVAESSQSRKGKRKRSGSKGQTSQSESEEPPPQPKIPPNSTPFVRSFMLQLCSPNRATLTAYRKLMRDKERRVKNAKLMLLEKDETRPKKRVKKAKIKPGDAQPGVSDDPGAYNGEKYLAEPLMRNIQLMPEHKILRARFVSLFAWPTVLSSLVPYERVGKFRIMKAAVQIKRKIPQDDNEENSGDEESKKKRRKTR